ncbi:hypothetical protein EMPS_05736 [Entomortierella parvispora]|uniref:C2H2-type domain-containing protein n=1 Tax=Entomortierella parvispora TaxID=205924 RepID=A0A9P3HBD8_9FUNG|nr:hypothetical protein EMPS_05736 [Entomortierella parvispora]
MSSNKSPTPELKVDQDSQQQQQQQDVGSAAAVADSSLTSSTTPSSLSLYTAASAHGTATSLHPSSSSTLATASADQNSFVQQQQDSTMFYANGSNGYLPTSTAQQQQSNLPLISSPLAMNFGNSQNGGGASLAYGSSNGNSSNGRSSAAYSYRSRNRRDSFQSGAAAANLTFSPPSNYSSPSSLTAGSLVFNGSGNQNRFSHLLNTPTGGAGPNGNQRTRCLSTSSMDSNASSVGFSRLTGNMASLSVQHPQHQVSATSSPYQSYSSSPQSAGGFQYHYSQHQQTQQHHQQQQQQQSTASASPSSTYPYQQQSPFSSPIHSQPSAVAQGYDSLSMVAASLTGTMYGSTPPAGSASDLLYPSTSSNATGTYGHVTSTPSQQPASYTSPSTRPVPFSLAPSSYYDQDPTRLLQQLELNYETTYGDQQQQQQQQQQQSRQYSTDHHQGQTLSEHGLGIAISGGMVRAAGEEQGENGGLVSTQDMDGMGSNPVHLASPTSPSSHLNMKQLKRGSTSSVTGAAAAAATAAAEAASEEPHAVLSEDGKTVKYLCSKCPRDFTTKSNLKRHLENINIHNTPYERTRDQKRWQGHEKKQASRAETTLRMRRWRQANREKNKFNDMRCRVYRNAKDKFGPEESDEKEAWIQAEIEKRKGMLLLRHSRKAGWKGVGVPNANGPHGFDSEQSSPLTGGGNPGDLSDGRFQNGMNNNNGNNSSFFNFSFSGAMNGHSIPAYGSVGGGGVSGGSMYDENAIREDGLKEGDRKFIELLKTENGPRRRRSRQAMNATINREQQQQQQQQQQNMVDGNNLHNEDGLGSMVTRSSSGNHLMMSSSGSRNSLSGGSNKKRRSRKQRSISEAHTMMQRRAIAGTSPATLGTGSGSLYSINNYMDASTASPSDQRLQELYQGVYQTRSLSQTLMMSKQQQQGQQQQDSMESIVTGLDVQSSSGRQPTGGLYGDRELSGWIDYSNNGGGNNNTASSPGASRQYPFPEMTSMDASHDASSTPLTPSTVRDRKGLAKAAGIRIDIPHHQKETSEWMMMDDNMVGGSATTIESQGSSVASHSKSSPQSANSTLQSPMLLNHQVPQQQQQPQPQQQHSHHTTSHHHPYHHHPYHIQDSQAGLIDATSSAHYSLKMATTGGFMSRSNKHQILHKAASHDMFSGFPTHQQQQHGTYGSYGNNNNTGSGYPLQPYYGASTPATTGSTGSGSFSLAQQAQVRSMQNAQGLLSHNSHLLNHHSSAMAHQTNGTTGGSGGGSEIDYFTTLVLPAVGDISVSSGNSGASGASYGNGAEMPNYLTRQQTVAPRRHSTQLSNLSM